MLIIPNMPPTLWCFDWQYIICAKLWSCNSITGCMFHFDWYGKKSNCAALKIWVTSGTILNVDSKLAAHRRKSRCIGHGNYEITNLYCIPFTQKVSWTPHYRLDPPWSTVPSHLLLPSCRNTMEILKELDAYEVKSDVADGPFDL